MELVQALDNETGDREDCNDEDILALISALVAGDYGARYGVKIPCRIALLRGETILSSKSFRSRRRLVKLPNALLGSSECAVEKGTFEKSLSDWPFSMGLPNQTGPNRSLHPPTKMASAVSITRNVQYVGLRSCAGSCVFNQYDILGQSALQGYIGCQYPWYNTCYCNSGIVPQITSFISSCVSKACSEVADAPNAVSAWEGYCSSAGYPVNNIAQTTVETVTSGTVTGPTTLLVTVPITAAPTVTATALSGIISSFADPNAQGTSTPTSSSSTTPAQLNVGAIAGGAVGGVIVIGIIAIIITMLILHDRRRTRHEQQMAPPQQAPQPPTYPFPPPAVAADKIPKTPATTYTAPAYMVERAPGEPELDSRTRMGPELDGAGNYWPRSNIPEVQGSYMG